MKNKAPLSLMEQLVMLLVFALAAALCLQVFVLSDRLSRRYEAESLAVTQVQNAAEAVKASGGDLERCAALLGGTVEEGSWQLRYGPEQECLVTVRLLPVSVPGLGSAEVSGTGEDGEVLFRVTVAWQEETDG